MALYDRIGKDYDVTRRADPGIVRRLIHHLQPHPDGLYLDVACGTGNYTVALANAGLHFHGLDQSEHMLSSLVKKHADVVWQQGDVAAMPFQGRTFSGAICTLAIHHFPDLTLAFTEIHRVIGRGRFVLFSADRDQMRGYWLNAYFPRAMAASVEQMPALTQVGEALRQAGFSRIRIDPYEVDENLQDLFLYSGKHRPGIYLDPRVRAGISTFASLADPQEVDAGLARLARDIDSGHIQRVIEEYHNELGDYAFVVCEKAPPV